VVQIIRPTSDVSVGAWRNQALATTSLSLSIDEVTLDTADFAESGASPTTADEYVFHLGDPDAPSIKTGHKLEYVIGKDSAGGDALTATVSVRQGTTTIASESRTVPDTATAYTLTLTEAQANTITNYADLRGVISVVKGDLLSWAPPTLVSPTVLDLSDAAFVTGTQYFYATTQDLRLTMSSPINKRLTIRGGRNIVMIGGEWTAPIAHCIEFRDDTGQTTGSRTIHIEGVLCNNPNTLDFDFIRSAGTTITLQIQNCRVEGLRGTSAGTHADMIQSINGVNGANSGGFAALRVDGFTGAGNYQGIFIADHDSTHGPVTLRRCQMDIVDGLNDQTGIYWSDGSFLSGGPFSFTTTLDRVYVRVAADHTVANHGLKPSLTDPRGATYRCVQSGDQITWPSLPAASAITGAVTDGKITWPSTDFVPSGTPGMSYVSPGYAP